MACTPSRDRTSSPDSLLSRPRRLEDVTCQAENEWSDSYGVPILLQQLINHPTCTRHSHTACISRWVTQTGLTAKLGVCVVVDGAPPPHVVHHRGANSTTRQVACTGGGLRTACFFVQRSGCEWWLGGHGSEQHHDCAVSCACSSSSCMRRILSRSNVWKICSTAAATSSGPLVCDNSRVSTHSCAT